MTQIEARAARRRAELLWQQQTRSPVTGAANDAKIQQEQQTARSAVDAKTARLRTLRLAKEAVQRETGESATSVPRERSATRTSPVGRDR